MQVSDVTWTDVYIAFTETVAGIKALGNRASESDIKRVVDSITMKRLGLNAKEADLFGDGCAGNAEWLLHAVRDSRFGKCCGNKKLRVLMQRLFVVDPVLEVFFLTTEKTISKSAQLQGGMSWNKTPQVTRKRKNKVMNWGTLKTEFGPVLRGRDTRVILIPNTDIDDDDVVYVSGPTLTSYCRKFSALWKRHATVFIGISYLGMWRELFAHCLSAETMATEHECISYHRTGEVKCSVYRIDNDDLHRTGFRPAHTKRIAVSNTTAAVRRDHVTLVSCLRNRLLGFNS